MGTPAYPADLVAEIREIKARLREISSSSLIVNQSGRPWTPAMISPFSMPSTTSTSFTTLQYISSFKSHESMAITIRISAPAGGSQVRIMMDDGVTVVRGPDSVLSGSHDITFKSQLPASIDSYSDFTLLFQVKSVTSGQTTSGIILNAYCRS